MNYFGGASLAAFFVVYTGDIDITVIAVMVPLLLVLYLAFHNSLARGEDANRHLAELNAVHLSTIETLAMAIDAKDQITHGHVRRVQFYAMELARAIGVRDKKEIRAIEEASLLHDMGKLAVPEHILNKPGPLTPAEFEKMKRHASIGAEILSAIEFPYPVVPIVRHHHEHWDGTGYPDGVKGEAIPIGARILTVVDCFDALTSDRPYRPGMPDDQAMQIIADRSGTMYDPEVVTTFTRIRPSIAQVAREIFANRIDSDVLTEITAAALPGSDVSGARSMPTDEMLTVYELARSLGGHLNLSDAGDIIVKHLRRTLPISVAVFYIYDDETDTLVARHVAGEGQRHLSGLRIPLGDRLGRRQPAHDRKRRPDAGFWRGPTAAGPDPEKLPQHAPRELPLSRRGPESVLPYEGRVHRGPQADRRSGGATGHSDRPQRATVRAGPSKQPLRSGDRPADR